MTEMDAPWLPWITLVEGMYGISIDRDAVDCAGLEELFQKHSAFTEQVRVTLTLIYGLNGSIPQSRADVASHFGVSLNRVSQILSKAKRQFRHPTVRRIVESSFVPRGSIKLPEPVSRLLPKGWLPPKLKDI